MFFKMRIPILAALYACENWGQIRRTEKMKRKVYAEERATAPVTISTVNVDREPTLSP
jgi:hypothetical protein